VRAAASQEGVGIHIHIAESKKMAKKIRRNVGFSEIRFLEELEFLDSDVVAAHCIHLTQEDIEILERNGVAVVHNPVANMKLAQGVAKVVELLDAGVTVGLGSDGAASNNSLNMFETMKVAALLQKTRCGDAAVLPARKVLEMATIDGAEALGLEEKVGSLEIGKRADMILINLRAPSLAPLHNLFASLVYSARGSDVDSVIVDGKVLMENRKMKTVDEREVIENAEDAAFNLLER
jgi:5-methylthioadenosine/S-adenosylhomocysteine deaminase